MNEEEKGRERKRNSQRKHKESERGKKIVRADVNARKSTPADFFTRLGETQRSSRALTRYLSPWSSCSVPFFLLLLPKVENSLSPSTGLWRVHNTVKSRLLRAQVINDECIWEGVLYVLIFTHVYRELRLTRTKNRERKSKKKAAV